MIHLQREQCLNYHQEAPAKKADDCQRLRKTGRDVQRKIQAVAAGLGFGAATTGGNLTNVAAAQEAKSWEQF